MLCYENQSVKIREKLAGGGEAKNTVVIDSAELFFETATI